MAEAPGSRTQPAPKRQQPILKTGRATGPVRFPCVILRQTPARCNRSASAEQFQNTRGVLEVWQRHIGACCFEVSHGVVAGRNRKHPNPRRARTGDIVRRVPDDHGSLEHRRGHVALACTRHRDATQVIATRRLFAERAPTEVIGESEVAELDPRGRFIVACEQREVETPRVRAPQRATDRCQASARSVPNHN